MKLNHSSRFWDLAAAGLFTVAGAGSFLRVWNYGLAWDAPFRWEAGTRKLAYYQDLWRGESTPVASDAYPGLFDLTLALFQQASPVDAVATGNLLCLAFGFFGLLGAWLLGRSLGGPLTGFLTLLLLLLTPRFYGHLFINPKDIPFAALLAWSLWAGVRVCRTLPHPPSWKSALLFGACLGLTMAVRIGGLYLLAMLALPFAWHVVQRMRQNPSPETLKLGLRNLGWGLLALTTAYLVLLPWWPYAQQNLFHATSFAVKTISVFPWEGTPLFMGQTIPAADLPWYYLPVWLMITLPVTTIGLLFIGLALFLQKAMGARRQGPSTHGPYIWLFLGGAMLFPFAYILVRQSVLYDGVRHFLFLLPPLTVLAALVLSGLIKETLSQRIPILGVLLLTLGGLHLVWTGLQMVRLHPYEYVYFNPLVGGLRGAEGRFETEYWGTSTRAAVEGLDAWIRKHEEDRYFHPWRIATVPPVERLLEYAQRPVVPHPLLARSFFPFHWVYVEADQSPDFFIGLTRGHFAQMMEGPIVVEVKRDGVVFCVVRDLRSAER